MKFMVVLSIVAVLLNAKILNAAIPAIMCAFGVGDLPYSWSLEELV